MSTGFQTLANSDGLLKDTYSTKKPTEQNSAPKGFKKYSKKAPKKRRT